jgi:hypothetical protein
LLIRLGYGDVRYGLIVAFCVSCQNVCCEYLAAVLH